MLKLNLVTANFMWVTLVAFHVFISSPLSLIAQVQIQQGNIVIQNKVNIRTRGGGANPFVASIPVPGELKRLLTQIQQLIGQEQFSQSRRAIQDVLNNPNEFQYAEDENSKDDETRITFREHVQNILKKDPENLLLPYQQEFDPQAQRLLEQYKATQDVKYLVEIIKKYFLTPTGLKAIHLMVNWHIDRAEYAAAKLHLRSMLGHTTLIKSNLPQLYLLTLKCAVELGDQHEQDIFTKKLVNEFSDIQIEWQGKSLALWTNSANAVFAPEIDQWLHNSLSPQNPLTILDWKTPRGDLSGNGNLAKTVPAIEARYTFPLLSLTECEQPHKHKRVQELIHKIQQHSDESQFLAWQPLFIGDTLLVKGFGTLKAFNINTGELLWESVYCENAFRFLIETFSSNSFNSAPSPASVRVLNGNEITTTINHASDRLASYLESRLYNDKLAAQISSDGERVYTINDLGTTNITSSRGLDINSHPLVSTEFNSLLAYDLKTGKLLWKTGSPNHIENASFNGYFLGVPILYNGLLYALTEQHTETHLTAFNPLNGEMIQSQPICASPFPINTPFGNNYIRRRLGMRPVLTNGLLICPTGYKAIYGIEPLTLRIVWYLELPNDDLNKLNEKLDMQNPQLLMMLQQRGVISPDQLGINSPWHFSEGLAYKNLVIMPGDHGKLLAVNISTGALSFEIDFVKAEYPVGFYQNKLITVTKHSIDAWSLSDGSPAWKESIIIDSPVGTPVISGNQIFVVTNKQQLLSYDLNNQELTYIHQLEHPLTSGNLCGNDQFLAMVGKDHGTIFLNEKQTSQQIAKKLNSPDQNVKFQAEIRNNQIRFFNDEQTNVQFLNELLKLLKSPPSNTDAAKDHLIDIITNHTLDGLRADFATYQPYATKIRPILKSPDLMFRIAEQLYRGHMLALDPASAYSSLLESIDHPAFLGSPFDIFSEQNKPDNYNLPRIYTSIFRTKEISEVTPERWVNARIQELNHQYQENIQSPHLTNTLKKLISDKLSKVKEGALEKENLYFTWQALSPLISNSKEEYDLLTMFLKLAQPETVLKEKILERLSQNDNPEHAAWSMIELALLKSQHKQSAQAETYIEILQTDYANTVAHEYGNVSNWLDLYNKTTPIASVTRSIDLKTKYGAYLDFNHVNGSRPNNTSLTVHDYNQPYSRNLFASYSSSVDASFNLRNDQNQKLFEVKLPRDASSSGLNRGTVIVDGNLLIFSNAIHLFAYDMSSYAQAIEPKLLWKISHDKNSNNDLNPNYNRVNIGRGFLEVEDNAAFNPISQASRLCYAPGQLVSILNQKLTAIDPCTSQILWTQENYPQGASLHADQKNLAMHDRANNKLHRYRNSDGFKLDEVTFPSHGWTHVDWFNGISIQKQDSADMKWLAGFGIDQQQVQPLWKQSFSKSALIFLDNSLRTPQILVYNGLNQVIQIDSLNGHIINKFDFTFDRVVWGNPKKIFLHQDHEHYYLITQFPSDSPLAPQAFIGVTKRDAHGPVFCYNKNSVKPKWTSVVQNQCLIEETPLDFPALCFGASNGNQTLKPSNGSFSKSVEVVIIDKNSGLNLINENLAQVRNSPNSLYEFTMDHKNNEYKILVSTLNVVIKPADAIGKKVDPVNKSNESDLPLP